MSTNWDTPASDWTADSYHDITSPPLTQPPARTIPDPAQAKTTQVPTVSAPTAQIPVTQPSTPGPDPVQAQAQAQALQSPTPPAPRHNRRRLVGTVIFAGLALAYFGSHASRLVPNPATSAAQSQAQAAIGPNQANQAHPTAAQAQVSTELAQATAFAKANGTYVGWPAPAGAQVASIANELVFSQTVGGVCYYAGLLPGQPAKALVDSTGGACAPGATALVQQSLNIKQSTQQGVADQALYSAATTAQTLAQDNGGSFTGLPALGVNGVTVVSQTPTSLTLSTPLALGGCRSVTITPVGAVPTPTTTSCPSSP
jgi:hypothetical protein